MRMEPGGPAGQNGKEVFSFVSEKIYIIIKNPDDGDPLDMREGRHPAHSDKLTVGVKFSYKGQYYGNYIYMAPGEAKMIGEAINHLLSEARDAELELMGNAAIMEEAMKWASKVD